MKLMSKKAISPGAVHNVPPDLRKVLISDSVARAKWEDITPLARNESYAGLSLSRNRKREDSTLSEYARNLRKECADLAAGQAVLTAENKSAKEIAGLRAAVLKVGTAGTVPATRLTGRSHFGFPNPYRGRAEIANERHELARSSTKFVQLLQLPQAEFHDPVRPLENRENRASAQAIQSMFRLRFLRVGR